jgi:putative N6-adenine-specific DNA methylase
VASGPGLEPLLLAEVLALGLPGEPARAVPGGVELTGDLGTLYRLNLELGLALKVLVRVGTFTARRFDTLIKQSSAVPWEEFCTGETRLEVKATCKQSRLYHSSEVVERIVEAISTRLGRPVLLAKADSEGPMLQVQARLVSDECTLSIDASGELLHRRGYRLATGKAPLREDLARALVIASGWDPETPLIDPFAGAGTICIEADLWARRVAPGSMRSFAFMHMPNFDAARWRETKEGARARERPLVTRIFASDRDPGAVAAGRANAERAQVTSIEFAHASLSQAPAFAAVHGRAGALVTNPPYGKRIGRDATLLKLYRTLGDRARALPGSFKVAMTVAMAQHAHLTGLPLESRLMTDHGGSKIYFSVGETRRNEPAQR